MGERDHSIKCDVCGLQRGGLNNYKCDCDEAMETPAPIELATPHCRPDLTQQRVRRIVQAAFEAEQANRPGSDVWYPQEFGATLAHRVAAELAAPMPSASPPDVAPDRFLPRTVTCTWCGNRYRSAVPSDIDRGFQGSHCASDVVQEGNDWFVRGGYGSDEHDMHRYLFVANPPAAPANPICDECISQRLYAGDLQDTGLEVDRRPADFGPRPRGTWEFVQQIRELVENGVGMKRLVNASCKEHDGTHKECEVCTEVRAYRKHQRWCGELEDDGEKYTEGCPEVAEQMREAASGLERLAAFWESKQPLLNRAETREETAPDRVPCPHCQAGEPSVWDGILFHYAHPAGAKLKMCHSPWRARCLHCSADVSDSRVEFCMLHNGASPETAKTSDV